MKSTTNCPLCKSPRTSLFIEHEKEKHRYKSCSKCGLIYVQARSSANELYKSYNGGWLKSLRRNLFSRFRKFDSFGNFEDFMKKADKITALIDKHKNKRQSEPIKILDIGCNKGFLLHSAINKNWDPFGIELVPELLIPFKQKHKTITHQLYTGSFDDLYKNFKKNSFDVITAIDVIEHFDNPRQSLKRMHQILKPGGMLLIQTPDSKSKNAKKTSKEWGALKPLEHLFLFNKQNYHELVEEIGFINTRFFKSFEEADGNFVAISKKATL